MCADRISTFAPQPESMLPSAVETRKRTLIYQDGNAIGSIPSGAELRSRHFMFQIRPGDFKRRSDGGYDAHPSICPGDFEALAGFRWEQTEEGR